MFSRLGFCKNSIIDTLTIVASDSVTVKYFMENSNGYIDGEKRTIDVFPTGIEEIKGSFYVLDSDTTFKLSFDTTLGEVSLYARTDILDIIEDEISHLLRYRYSCNEQLASKLIALLAEQGIAKFKGQKFRNENEVEKLIRLLLKNQKSNGLWGWWSGSPESNWISLHVLEALMHAEKQGYSVKLDKRTIVEKLIWELESCRDFNAKLGFLRILRLMNARVNYSMYISDLEKTKELNLNSLLTLIELRQMSGLKYNLDTLSYFQKSTILGNIFYNDGKQKPYLMVNDIQNTLHAYRIMKADTTYHSDVLRKIRNYLYECRKDGYWRNTYESKN